MAETSFSHIESVYTSKFGDNFPRLTASRDTLGPWNIVQEYLCILKLLGEILQYTGPTTKTIQYLERGLHVADQFKLATWGAIFSSRLIEQQLTLGDLELATSNLQ
ncbi:unnamed protein product, partial [Candidula unifasciata]